MAEEENSSEPENEKGLKLVQSSGPLKEYYNSDDADTDLDEQEKEDVEEEDDEMRKDEEEDGNNEKEPLNEIDVTDADTQNGNIVPKAKSIETVSETMGKDNCPYTEKELMIGIPERDLPAIKQRQFDYAYVLSYFVNNVPLYKKLQEDMAKEKKTTPPKYFMDLFKIDLKDVTHRNLDEDKFYEAAKDFKSRYAYTKEKKEAFFKKFEDFSSGPVLEFHEVITFQDDYQTGLVKELNSVKPWYDKKHYRNNVLFLLNGHDTAYSLPQDALVKQLVSTLHHFNYDGRYLCELLTNDVKHKFFMIMSGHPSSKYKNMKEIVNKMKLYICKVIKDTKPENIEAFYRTEETITIQINDYYVNNRDERLKLAESIRSSIEDLTLTGQVWSKQHFDLLDDGITELIPFNMLSTIKSHYNKLNSTNISDHSIMLTNSFITGSIQVEEEVRLQSADLPNGVVPKNTDNLKTKPVKPFNLEIALLEIPKIDVLIQELRNRTKTIIDPITRSTEYRIGGTYPIRKIHDLYVELTGRKTPGCSKLSSVLTGYGILGDSYIQTFTIGKKTMKQLMYLPEI